MGNIFLILFIFLSSPLSFAKLRAKWMGVASVYLDDGKTRILFDPAWTKPEISHWLNLRPFKSDEKLVRKILSENKIQKLDAVFVSHSHFDHIVDAPSVSKITGAFFYTDKNFKRIVDAYQLPSIPTRPLEESKKIKLGNFIITPIKRSHASILNLFHFLPGEVPDKTELSFWDYREGETWFYLLEHPEGTILIDQASKPYVEKLKKYTQALDIIFQGVANRANDEMILNGYPRNFAPSHFVPLHFDNFFLTLKKEEQTYLPGIALLRLLEKLNQSFKKITVHQPVFGKEIVIKIQPKK